VALYQIAIVGVREVFASGFVGQLGIGDWGLVFGWLPLAMPVSGFAGIGKVAIAPAAFGERARASEASPQTQDDKTL
jgi:hypothetical protein